ncbi:MAG: hypothetical protein ACOYMW_16140 [Candidatus Competibacteraceae bacterium]
MNKERGKIKMNDQQNVFHKAVEAMHLLVNHSRIAYFIEQTIIHSKRFIIPDAGKMTANKPYSMFITMMTLPAKRVSLLRTTTVRGQKLNQICVAATSEFVGIESEADFFIADCIYCYHKTKPNLWAPSRPIGVKIGVPIGGIQTYEIEAAIEEEKALFGFYDDHKSGWGALNALTELMVMLHLENTKALLIKPDEATNKERITQGQSALFDYHILTTSLNS